MAGLVPGRQLGVQGLGAVGLDKLGCRAVNAALFLKRPLPFTFFLSQPVPLTEVCADLDLLQDLA